MQDFSPAATLAKVAAVNALYYTNVFALVRVAEHSAGVLARSDLDTAGVELVDALADVPKGGTEKRKVRRLSLAAKFAHFFIDENRFPIYDKYAVRMVAKHAGTPVTRLDGNYAAFTAAFNDLAIGAGLVTQRRRLDRYLWIQGQYEEWQNRGTASSGDLEAAFKRGDWPTNPAPEHALRVPYNMNGRCASSGVVNMTVNASFWSQFEELAVGGRDVDCLKTETRQREQPDHHGQHILGGTTTKTATREQDDQDPDPRRFAAIPPGVACATQTMTKMREEPDQDQGGAGVIPMSAGPKTQTLTEVREEQDQDQSAHKALGLPRAPATHA